ncbi:hypothetical protein COOONC_00137 [Cooperia oncophora]
MQLFRDSENCSERRSTVHSSLSDVLSEEVHQTSATQAAMASREVSATKDVLELFGSDRDRGSSFDVFADAALQLISSEYVFPHEETAHDNPPSESNDPPVQGRHISVIASSSPKLPSKAREVHWQDEEHPYDVLKMSVEAQPAASGAQRHYDDPDVAQPEGWLQFLS